MTHQNHGDPTLQAAIRRALAPYGELLPSELLRDMEETLCEELTGHPVSTRLLRQLAPPPVVHKSGERDLEEAGPQEAKPGAGAKRSG